MGGSVPEETGTNYAGTYIRRMELSAAISLCEEGKVQRLPTRTEAIGFREGIVQTGIGSRIKPIQKAKPVC